MREKDSLYVINKLFKSLDNIEKEIVLIEQNMNNEIKKKLMAYM